MSSKLTREQVLKLAKLSQLQLTDDEIQRYCSELGSILEYFERLNDVDVSDLKPTYQVTGLDSVTREDEPKPQQASPDALLSRVPRTDKRYIKVGRMI